MQKRTRFVAAVALGANLGEPERTFKRALNLLERDHDVTVLRRSSWHATPPVGAPDQPAYTNGAVLVETRLEPAELLAALRAIEEHLGRERGADGERFGPRALDLDLLFARQEGEGPVRVRTDELTLPHPRMEERSFVLAPLAEVAPQHVLARSGNTVAEQAELVAAGGGLLALESVEDARAWCARSAEDGGTLGFVPTMGALHDGHLELVRRAARENDRVCVSIFVNPLQFDDPKDLERYPRDFERDARLLAGAGASMCFTGTLEGFFPDGVDGARVPAGDAAIGLEGEFRAGHLDGVATIVARLFEVARPTRAYFGAKDFQQCLVVEALAAERFEGLEVVRCPIVRATDGLALSSRNELLSRAAREQARALSGALLAADARWRSGEHDAETLRAALERELRSADGIELEYAELRDPKAWSPERPSGALDAAVALVAARVGGVRLIDNMELGAS
ncbi:MAG: pantoate--beta-alanine ligase [Planctomycetota bacterium]